MNVKLAELAYQAGFMDSWFSDSGDDYEEELRKFAELIIKDCCRIVNLWTDEDVPEGEEDVFQTRKIKQNFGLQE